MSDGNHEQHQQDRHDLVERLVRRAGPRPPVPEIVARRIRDTVENEWLQMLARRNRRQSRRWVAAGLAASVLLALLAFRTLRDDDRLADAVFAHLELVAGDARFVPPVEGPGGNVGPGTRIETAEDGRVALRTAGGRSLRIDEGTSVRLEYPGLVVLEHGEVYVDAGIESRRSDRGLTVRTPLGEACEVGTQYAVAFEPPRMLVRVREGQVDVTHEAGSETAVAGVEIDVRPGGETTRRSIPPDARVWDWVRTVAPAPDIDGRPLGEVLEWVSRETGRTVAFSDAGLAERSPKIELSGSIEGLTPTEALGAVLQTCGLTYRLEAGRFVVESATEAPDEG